MEDLIYLSARYAVKIAIENRSWGTSSGDISLGATAIAEHEGRRLSAYAHVYGADEKAAELREEAIRAALARLRRQAEALDALL